MSVETTEYEQTNNGKRYQMGQCVLALNKWLEKNGSLNNYILRFTSVNPFDPNNFLNGSFPILYFKELHYFDKCKLNSHVFTVNKDGKIVDPLLFPNEQIKDFREYMEKITPHLELGDKNKFIIDVQELDEVFRKHNRSQFNTIKHHNTYLFDVNANELEEV